MHPALRHTYYYSQRGRGYSEAAQAVFDNMDSQPPTALKTAMAAFVDSQVLAGNWDKIIDFVFARMDTEANALKGWKGNCQSSLVGGAWWTQYQGWWTDSAINGPCVDTGFIPNDYAAFGLSDAGFGCSLRVNETTGTGSSGLFGVLNAASNSIALNQSGSAGTNLSFTVNSSTLASYLGDTVFNDHTFYAVERVNNTQARLMVNGVLAATGTANAAASKATDSVYLGGRNNAGTHQLHMNGTYGFWVAYQAVGFDHTSFYSALQTLDAAIDAIIGDILFLFEFGQSNAGGSAESNRLLALTSYTDATPVGANVFQKAAFNTVNDGKWRPMSVGVNTAEPGQVGSVFAGGVSFAQTLIDSQGSPAFYVNGARSGSSLATIADLDWNPANANECFDIAFDYIFTPSYNKLAQHFPNNTLKVVLAWHQGEADAVSNSATYADSFDTFVTAVRAYHASLATAPLIITKLYYNLNAGETVINDAFDAFVGANPNAYVINPAAAVTYPRKVDLPAGTKATYPPSLTDDNHNSYEFQVKKGEMIYSKLIEIGYL